MARSRPIVGGCAAFEPFDDDHATAAAGAGMLWFFRLGRMGVACFDGIDGNVGREAVVSQLTT